VNSKQNALVTQAPRMRLERLIKEHPMRSDASQIRSLNNGLL
jgi:hypothetical protein